MPEDSLNIPEYALKRPHVDYEPTNDGVFG